MGKQHDGTEGGYKIKSQTGLHVISFGFLLSVSVTGFLMQTRLEASEDAILRVQDGLKYLRLEDYEKANEYFDALLVSDENNALAWTYKGLALAGRGNASEALKCIDRAMKIDPSLRLAWYAKSQTLEILGRVSESNEYLAKLTSSQPTDALGFFARALAWSGQDPDKAINDLRKAIKLRPKYAEAYAMRGILYRQKRDYDLAISDFTKAIEIDSQFASAYTSRGNCYRQKGDLARAIEDHTKAINLNPKYGTAYFNRGRAYVEKGDYRAARSDWEKAVSLEPPNSRIRAAADKNLQTLKEEGHY